MVRYAAENRHEAVVELLLEKVAKCRYHFRYALLLQ